MRRFNERLQSYRHCQLIRAEIRKTQVGPIKKVTGPAGERGPQGESGIQGPQGPRGNDGKQGPKGDKGIQGKQGPAGARGEDGDDGVGISRVEQDIDNNIVIYLTDGNFYTVEMPLIQDDGSLAKEVHFKVGGGSGGSGSVDLSGYVKRPTTAQRTGQWLAYKEDPGGTNRTWQALTTDMVETNPGIIFRDSKGRFAPTPDEWAKLTDQLKVNRFIWDHIQMLDIEKSGIIIGPNPPVPPAGEQLTDGTFWFDNTEEIMQLFIWHTDSNAWLPVAPPATLESRVRQGEITQEAIIAQIQESLVEQDRIIQTLDSTSSDLNDKISKEGENVLVAERQWIIRQKNLAGNNRTFINIHDGEMSLYNVAYPGNPSHAANQQYVDDKFDAIEFPEVDLNRLRHNEETQATR